MSGFPGWYPDPTGRHPERYFGDSGLPTQLVRNNGVEFNDEGPSVTPETRTQTPTRARRIPISSYRAPADDSSPISRTRIGRADTAMPTVSSVEVQRRRWWLGGLCCVLAVLLAIAVGVIVQQHHQADSWQSRYHAEVSRYQQQERKSVALYASLVTTLQQLSAATDHKNTP